jgi:hypothetical protein
MDTNPYQAPTSNVADLGVGPGIEVTWGRAGGNLDRALGAAEVMVRLPDRSVAGFEVIRHGRSALGVDALSGRQKCSRRAAGMA